MSKERRNNLNEYYKHVYICSSCRKKYGSDNKRKYEELCPVCMPKGSRFNDN